MGRYSFFISHSFLGGYSVYAVGELDNDLSITDEQYSTDGSYISSSDQNILDSGNVGLQSQKTQTSENTTEISQENSSENSVSEIDTPSSFQGDPLEGFIPSLSRNNSGWYRDHKWGFQNVYYIGGGFTNWNLNPLNAADNVNNLMFAIRDVVQTLQTQVNKIRNDLTILNNAFIATRNAVNAHDNWTATVQQPQINKNEKDLKVLNQAFIDTRNQVNSHDKWVANTLLPIVNKTKSDLSVLNSAFVEHRNWVNNVQQKDIKILNQAFVEHRNWVNNVQQPQIDKNEKDLKVLNSAFIDVRDHVKSHDKWVADTLVPVLDKTRSDLTTLNSAFVTHRDWVKNAQQPQIDKNTKDIEDLKNGFSWSDVGIIAALVLVKDSIDSFKTAFTDLFSVDELVGLSAHEGKFTRMIKSQFITLRNDLRDLFKSYFGVQMDGEIPTPTGLFSKLLDDLIYKVRYTTIQEFSELKEFLEAQGTNFLDILNLVNESLLAIRQNQISISEWLKLIYEKPIGNVIAPPFDFDRLEQILKKFSFGEIINEAGTNFWDFMTSLIDNLGKIIGKGIDGLTQILSKILDILDGLIDTLISLIIPKDWEFLDKGFGSLKNKFDVKFKIFLDLGDLIKNLFSPTKKDFLKAISFTWLGVNFDFTQSQSSLDIYVPKFRGSIAVVIWALTAVYIYRKITGTGDVINDS